MSETKSNPKKSKWAFVVYPESLPDDWMEQLQQTGLMVAISPLHDKDIEPTGEPKKSHYHVIACWDGPTTYNVVKGLTDRLNAPSPIPLEQVRGYYRYLTHKDNPEKVQYSEDDIKTLNGFNIQNYIEMTKAEVFEIKRKVQNLIREKNIVEYAVLLDFLMDENLFSELEIAQNNTMLFNNYIKSRRFGSAKLSDVKVIKVDPKTGEVIDNG
jgi:Plasmid replication protein.